MIPSNNVKYSDGSTVLKCSKCNILNIHNRNKYCGDGTDKDNGHRWEKTEFFVSYNEIVGE